MWLLFVVLVIGVLVAVAGRLASRSRVDPTQVTIPPETAVRLRGLAQEGKRVQAIAELRQATGLGLRESAAIVEKMARQAPRPGDAPPGPPPEPK